MRKCFTVPINTRMENNTNTWYDKELHKLNNTKQKLYFKYIRKRNISNKVKYHEARNLYFHQIKIKKQLYFHSLFIKYKNNMKSTWTTINSLLGKIKSNAKKTIIINKNNNNIESNDPITIANTFNSYFSNVAPDLIKKLPKSTAKKFQDFLHSPNSSSMYIFPCTLNEIKLSIDEIKPKSSSGIDGIPCKVLKFLPDNILLALTHIYNQSLSMGIFIDQFKISKVIPV